MSVLDDSENSQNNINDVTIEVFASSGKVLQINDG